LLPKDADLIEVNFIGWDMSGARAGETYVLEDIPVLLPRPAGLVLEKLLTDRGGEKGDLDEIEAMYGDLAAELRYAVRSGLSTLSLLEPRLQMPDPTRHRPLVAGLLAQLERTESNT
jgi:hypothetical protein